jgi:hypothetical protein
MSEEKPDQNEELLSYRVSQQAYERLKGTVLIWAGALALITGVIGYKTGDLMRYFEDARQKMAEGIQKAKDISQQADDVTAKAKGVDTQYAQLSLQEDSFAKSSVAIQKQIHDIAVSLQDIIAATKSAANSPQEQQKLDAAGKQLQPVLQQTIGQFAKLGNLEGARWTERNFDTPPERKDGIPQPGDILRAQTETYSRTDWPKYIPNKGLILAPAASVLKENQKVKVLKVDSWTLKNGTQHYWFQYELEP